MHIKYTLNDKIYSCWNSADRVTTPSLIFNKNKTTLYTPLFVIDQNKEGTLDQHWFYKCGDLSVNYNNQKYYAPLSRRYINTISDIISTTIKHSGKTGTTTTTTSKTVTPSGKHDFGTQFIAPGTQTVYANVTVNYGVTFLQTPAIYINYGGTLVSAGTSSCVIRVSATGVNSGTSGSNIYIGITTYLLTVIGNVATTTTTYPNETKSAVAQGNFNYGVTYPSVPSLTVNSGGISATNNSGNKSFLAKKTLTGTVAYNKTATLSQAFTITHKGDFGLN